MLIDDQPKLTWWRTSRLLAGVSALMFLAAALAFAILLPAQIEAGNTEGARWFTLSAFPLMVVVWIAVFTRLQRQIDQKHGRRSGADNDIDWLQE